MSYLLFVINTLKVFCHSKHQLHSTGILSLDIMMCNKSLPPPPSPSLLPLPLPPPPSPPLFVLLAGD